MRVQLIYCRFKLPRFKLPILYTSCVSVFQITIRAYSVTKVNDNTKLSKSSTNSKSSSVATVPAPLSVVKRITATKRKPVESILDVMTKFQRQW